MVETGCLTLTLASSPASPLGTILSPSLSMPMWDPPMAFSLMSTCTRMAFSFLRVAAKLGVVLSHRGDMGIWEEWALAFW